MESIAAIFSAAGVGGVFGGVVTSLLQAWLSRRAILDERRFDEKKEAYANLLTAIHQSEVEGTVEAAKYVGHCRNMCDLVASDSVRHQIVRLFATNPLNDGTTHPERPRVLGALKHAMRRDLGFDSGESGTERHRSWSSGATPAADDSKAPRRPAVPLRADARPRIKPKSSRRSRTRRRRWGFSR
ncbi:MAG TPA: hypothetical protein VGH40_16305 [Roseiarcus sp.]|jgi:hypothetical protein